MLRSEIRGVVLVLGIVVALSLAVTVTAHGNYLTADTQMTGDGTVQIEGVFMVTEGWVVIHSAGPGGLEDVVGHAAPDQNAFVTDLSVTVDSAHWTARTGNRSLWAVLHHDADNNGEFNASSDPPIGGREEPAHAVRIDIRKGDRSAFVLAEREQAQPTNASTVVIRRAHLPKEGYLVVRANDNGSPGTIVGNRSLGGGAYNEVRINVAENFYHHQPEEFSLWAVVYRSNGDGQLDDEDKPMSVNGSMVSSQFRVNRTGTLEPDHTHSQSGTKTPVATATQSPVTHDDHDHDHRTDSTPPATTSTPALPTTPTAGANGPGMGFTATTIALLCLGICRYNTR